MQSLQSQLKAKDDQLATVLAKLDQVANVQADLANKVATLTPAKPDPTKADYCLPTEDDNPNPTKRRRVQPDRSGWKRCPHCGRKVSPKGGHTPTECRENPDNVEKAKKEAEKGTADS